MCLLDAAAGNNGGPSTENSKERYMSVLCTPLQASSSESVSGNPNTSATTAVQPEQPSSLQTHAFLEPLRETFSLNSAFESVHALTPADVSALHALGTPASHR